MTSMFDYDDSANLVYNAKTAGKSLVTAKHEVLTKTGEFLFLAHTDKEFALRCQMVEKDIESIARRKMSSISDSKFKLVRALHEEWQLRHANCECKTAAVFNASADDNDMSICHECHAEPATTTFHGYLRVGERCSHGKTVGPRKSSKTAGFIVEAKPQMFNDQSLGNGGALAGTDWEKFFPSKTNTSSHWQKLIDAGNSAKRLFFRGKSSEGAPDLKHGTFGLYHYGQDENGKPIGKIVMTLGPKTGESAFLSHREDTGVTEEGHDEGRNSNGQPNRPATGDRFVAGVGMRIGGQGGQAVPLADTSMIPGFWDPNKLAVFGDKTQQKMAEALHQQAISEGTAVKHPTLKDENGKPKMVSPMLYPELHPNGKRIGTIEQWVDGRNPRTDQEIQQGGVTTEDAKTKGNEDNYLAQHLGINPLKCNHKNVFTWFGTGKGQRSHSGTSGEQCRPEHGYPAGQGCGGNHFISRLIADRPNKSGNSARTANEGLDPETGAITTGSNYMQFTPPGRMIKRPDFTKMIKNDGPQGFAGLRDVIKKWRGDRSAGSVKPTKGGPGGSSTSNPKELSDDALDFTM